MRSTLLAVLASAALFSASGCAQNIGDLVADTACGSVKSITKCLGTADLQRLDEIERCYSSNGCSAGEATVEAVWFSKDCRALEAEEVRGDLKRRADSTESTTADATTSKTTAKTTTKTTAKSTTAPSSTTASTTSDSSTSAASTTSSTTTASSTTSSSASTTEISSTTASTTGTSLTCSITSTKSTSVCVTTSGASTCSATTVESASCAPGLICFSATAGADVCMKKDDSLTTSGVIVTIAFGVAIGAAIIAFAVMGFRNSKKFKQQEYSRQLAAASSKGADVEAQSFSHPNRSEAALPLITPGGARSDYSQQTQQDYFGQSGNGGNSVTPPGGRGNAPQLHQGLGALGQETRY